MKNQLLVGLLALALFSCGSAANEQQTVTLNPQDIRVSPVVHDSLTAEQVEKITKIQSTFAEVNPTSLAETLTDFKRDQHPDGEIAIWQAMAQAYKKYLSSQNQPLRLEAKKEVYSLLLMRSMMPAEQVLAQSRTMFLPQQEAEAVLNLYSAEAKPIVIK